MKAFLSCRINLLKEIDMAEEKKAQKYKCLICGEIVEPVDGVCPICGAGEDMLVPVDDDGNEIR